MMNKIYFDDVTKELEDIYIEKNKKYGNSFKDLYDDLGIISAVSQILHKSARLKYLVQNNEDIEDTLKDIANYCIMTLMHYE